MEIFILKSMMETLKHQFSILLLWLGLNLRFFAPPFYPSVETLDIVMSANIVCHSVQTGQMHKICFALQFQGQDFLCLRDHFFKTLYRKYSVCTFHFSHCLNQCKCCFKKKRNYFYWSSAQKHEFTVLLPVTLLHF